MFLKTRKKLAFLFVFALCAAGFLALSASSAVYANTEDLFSPYQAIPTDRTQDWESFVIDGETYLAVAVFTDNFGNANTDSKIYKWNGASFIEFQSISTYGAADWESFVIDGETYLAVGYHRNNAYQYNLNSKIYKWNGEFFDEFQAISTSLAKDWESFTINGEAYLAVANEYNGSTYNIDSKIYKWNGTSFAEFQAIPTNSAMDWESFIIDDEVYLAVINNKGSSKIYKWNGTYFVEFQTIVTSGAYDWESFIINDVVYLAVANKQGISDYSKIYKWNGALFEEIQSILTSDAQGWESFMINGETYLAVANAQDQYGYETDSNIYKWNGASFEEIQAILTSGGNSWESFMINGETYLIISKTVIGVDSIIYKANINNNPVDLEDGLIAYYPFSGNANDESGNGYDGTVYGASLAADRFGNPSSAYHFDGQDYINVDMDMEIFYDYFTIGVWVNFDNFNNDYPYIMGGENLNLVLYGMGPIYGADKQRKIGFYQQDGAVYETRIGDMESDSKLDIGEWYFLAIVRDGLDYTMYINGEIVGQVMSNIYTPMIGSYLTIGSRRDYNGGAPWKGYENSTINGYIDDIRIYDRALSEGEIQAIYGLPVYCGNGNIDPGEECDDGNAENGDGCDENCVIEPEEKPDPVILIPGAMGSWRTPDGWALDPITYTYVDIWNAIKAAGYEPGEDLFSLPYEWRNSNIFTAALLKEKIDAVKEICECDKVDIVAHSMGGLVARTYIQGEDYEDDVDQLIFLGTPHKGATMAYLAWEGGSFGDGLMARLQEKIFKHEAKHYGYKNIYSYIRGSNIVSVKELLPVYDYLIDMRKKRGLRIYPDGYPINSFLDNLNDFNSTGNLDDVNIVNILGRDGEKSTLNNIVVRKKKFKDGRWEHGYPLCLGKIKCRSGFDFSSGDGTVPERSNIDFYGSENVFIENASHRAMVSKAQARVVKELTGEEPAEIFSWGEEILRLLIIQIFSPADFTIINPLGEKLGRNFASSTADNEIGMAFYSGFSDGPEFATIPNPVFGEYTVQVIGTDRGKYTLNVSYLDGGKDVDKDITRTISEGEIHEYTFVYSEDGGLSAILPIGAAGFDKLIADTKDLYSSGEIKKRRVKTSLVARFKHLKKKYESIGEEIKGCGYKKWSEKKDKITRKYIKFRLNMIKKQLRFYLRQGWITEEARNLLVNDINAIMGTLK